MFFVYCKRAVFNRCYVIVFNLLNRSVAIPELTSRRVYFNCVFARVFCNHGFSVLFVSYANFDTFAVCKQVAADNGGMIKRIAVYRVRDIVCGKIDLSSVYGNRSEIICNFVVRRNIAALSRKHAVEVLVCLSVHACVLCTGYGKPQGKTLPCRQCTRRRRRNNVCVRLKFSVIDKFQIGRGYSNCAFSDVQLTYNKVKRIVAHALGGYAHTVLVTFV